MITKRLTLSLLVIAITALLPSCISDKMAEAMIDFGKPKRVERVERTGKGYGYEVVYEKDGKEATRYVRTDSKTKRTKLVSRPGGGPTIPFTVLDPGKERDHQGKTSPTGERPHALIFGAPGKSLYRAKMVTEDGSLLTTEFPDEKPNLPVRALVPLGVAADIALLPASVATGFGIVALLVALD